MELSDSLKTVAETGERANFAAETALLAAESVVAIGSEVRSAVRSAIDEAASSAGGRSGGALFWIQLLTFLTTMALFGGIYYLTLQNGQLERQLQQQQQTIASMEEYSASLYSRGISGLEREQGVMVQLQQQIERQARVEAESQKVVESQKEQVEALTLQLQQLREARSEKLPQPPGAAIGEERITTLEEGLGRLNLSVGGMKVTISTKLDEIAETMAELEEREEEQVVEQEDSPAAPYSYNSSRPMVYRFP